MPALEAAIARAVEEACLAELAALKPGNVGAHGDGHGMALSQFEASAKAIAGPLARPGICLGQRVLEAVNATWAAAGCNTNLGIVLLAAPLAHGAWEPTPLTAGLRRTLAGLDQRDAALVFEAIRLANPGGLGRAGRFDVSEPPTVGLVEAMREAAHRDSVARQYATDFRDIFERGVPCLRDRIERGWSESWAAAAVYLDFLAAFPDSHVARKFGIGTARRVSRAARPLVRELLACADPETAAPGLLTWDRELKAAGINPGTSADLTVATLLAARLMALPGRSD